jgi:large repetitive protein
MFGSVAASSFTVVSAMQINATSPAKAAGTVDVTVTTPEGTSATSSSDQFTFMAPPPPPQPSLSISSVSMSPGSGGTTFTFTVTLSMASTQTVTVSFATADGSATVADNDYLANSGTLTFNPGQTSLTISVQVPGDSGTEPSESFYVDLSGAVNASIANGQGTGTIMN